MNATVTTNAREFNEALEGFVRLWTRKDGRSAMGAIADQAFRLSHEMGDQLKRIAPAAGAIRAERLAAFRQGIGLRIHRRHVGMQEASGVNTLSQVVANRLSGPTHVNAGLTKRGKQRRVARRIGGRTVQFWQDQYKARADKLRKSNHPSALASGKLAFQSMLADLEIKYREKARSFLAFAVRFKGGWKQLDKVTGFTEYITSTNREGGSVKLAKFATGKAGEGAEAVLTWGSELGKSSAAVGDALNKPKAMGVIDAALRVRSQRMMEYIQTRLAKDWAKA